MLVSKMAPTWMCHKKVLLLCVMSLCLIVSTVAFAQKVNSSCITSNTFKSLMNSSNKDFHRLPRHIIPKNYKLNLWPDMNKKIFRGSVAIQLEILQPTHTIELHSNKLSINSVSFRGKEQNISIKSITASSDRRELIIVDLFEDVNIGNYEIYINFGGKLDNRIVGFYASSLKNNKTSMQLLPALSKFGSALSVYCNLQTRTIVKMVDCVTKKSERLSPAVTPVHYNLLLHPDLKSGLFQGSVQIDTKLSEEKDHVKLNTHFLDIQSVRVLSQDKLVPLARFFEDVELEQLVIEFKNSVSSGYYKICVDFSGSLTKSIVGFYLSQLKGNRTMVASKFQPTYARQAFPCFDEPDFKATFDITLIKPQSYTALSNMNEISKTIDTTTNLETVNFATSVPMSTYLACFVICDFDHKEVKINANGIGKDFTLRSFAQKDETHKIDFAQDIGKRATEFYIKYYQVPFPLPKLDMIAIPDYVSGATEHWGLITYRETAFLVNEATASAANKIAVANTIAHELAHMWFGNLVTMKWWDEVWLNEGFASYMQCKSLNAIEPSWTMLDQFLIKTLHPVLVTDAKLSSHPIVQTVATPDQITAIFDSISYNKGASILRMLEGFTGEENFRRGVSDYLKKYEFGNTVTQQLLSSLEPYFVIDNSGLNLTYIMDTWTRQKGYPLVTVKAEPESRTYTITQSRFLLDPEASSPNDSVYNYRWYVPITYKTNKKSRQNIIWFPDNVESVQVKLEDDETWLKINNNQVGFYRVNYTEEMWQTLSEQLKAQSEMLSISDRAHLLNDAFSLAMARVIPYSQALEISTYLSVEQDYVPWTTAGMLFTELSERLINSSVLTLLQKFVQSLITPLYEKQSWQIKETGVINSLLRSKILSLATRFELPDAKSKVRQMFLSWLNSRGSSEPVNIETDLRHLVYFYGMKASSQEEWDKLWVLYLKEDDVQEKSKIRLALSAPRDEAILKRLLDLAWDESNIRSQDYLSVVQSVSSNPAGTSLVWDDVRARWPAYVDRFTLNSRYLGNLIPGITGSFDTEARLKEMEEFFSKYPEAGAGESARKRALENVRYNIKWIKNYDHVITSWLTEKTRN